MIPPESSVLQRLASYPVNINYGSISGYHQVRHWHTGLELHHCEFGEGYYGVLKHRWALTPLVVTLLDARYEHCLSARGIPEYRRTVVEFLPSLIRQQLQERYSDLRRVLPTMHQPLRQFILSGREHKILDMLLAHIHEEFSNRTPLSKSVISRYIIEILDLLSKSGQRGSIAHEPSPYELLLVERLVKLVEEQLGDEFDITDLARQVGMNAGHLRRVFQNVRGVGLGEYIVLRRLGKAQDLINNGSAITDAAHMCGYQELSSFSRAFKKRMGVSPRTAQDLR